MGSREVPLPHKAQSCCESHTSKQHTLCKDVSLPLPHGCGYSTLVSLPYLFAAVCRRDKHPLLGSGQTTTLKQFDALGGAQTHTSTGVLGSTLDASTVQCTRPSPNAVPIHKPRWGCHLHPKGQCCAVAAWFVACCAECKQCWVDALRGSGNNMAFKTV